MSELAEYSRLIQKFDTCRTAFMMCHGQENVEPHTRNFHNTFQVAKAMATVHQLLGPEWSVFVAAELYSQDTRHAYHDVQLPEDAIIAENVQTSMLVPEVQLYILGDAERGIPPVQQAIIWGCETYGCVLQTSDELLAHGIRVAVLVDGCTSRIAEMHDTAVLQMSHWDGLMLTTAPSAIVQLTRSDARFVKPIIQILKTFAADWSTTQPLPELSSQRVGGDGDPATAVSDATAASPVTAVTTAGDAATKTNSAYSGKGY
ncbi:Isochorismatase family, putative [Leishmania lindenbergi]|uniref:Isochorismatase family n=1 Tax=Leishmania lindenbergi TaxID=651832 RepID=A0AAW3ASE1_9TRYP